MKILLIHNSYATRGGEETVVDFQVSLLRERGHEVYLYSKSSLELHGIWGHIKGFFLAIRNGRTIKEVTEIIREFEPDVALVHNLYPIISPAILPHIRKTGTPVVMFLHNYRLLCPNGLFFTKGEICERCTGGGRELNCILRNCERSPGKSFGYALRNWWARVRRYYLNNVNIFVALTEFQRDKLISGGFDPKRIIVSPNGIDAGYLPLSDTNGRRDYIGYVGRVSREKGAEILLEAARKLPDVKFRFAGKVCADFLSGLGDLPVNVEFCGAMNGRQLANFYTNAKILVAASIWYEGFPMVLLESMFYKTPIIAQNLGGIPEIIVDNYNGLLFKAADASDLAAKVDFLWNSPELLEKFADNGYEKLRTEYSQDNYYMRLMNVIEKVKKHE